jgi:SpoVK/Ycf46/Vps4 family AAA+-type ATPase
VGSDIEAICREATLGAVRNFLGEKKDKKKLVITKSDFSAALKNQKEKHLKRSV